jgi:hypothetical protein
MHFFRWRYLLYLFLAALGVAIGCGLDWWFFPSVPTTSLDAVDSVEITLLPLLIPRKNLPDGGTKQIQIKTTDRSRIATLLKVFHGAQRASEHKCGSIGTLTIRTRSGRTEQLEILAGHDSANWEYRYAGRINRVDRESFLAALEGIGVERIFLERR